MEKKRREIRNRSLSLCVRWACFWGILAVLLACPSIVRAQYIEFELDAADLGDLVRENAEKDSFFNDTFCPRFFSSEGFFLDDIDFPSTPGPFIRPAPGSYGNEGYYDLPTLTNNHPTQLVVPVVLGFKYDYSLYDPAMGINDFDFTYDADIVFGLSATPTQICFSYVGVESAVTDIEDYTDEIAGFLGGMGCLPVDLTAFDMLLSGLVPAHAGVTSEANVAQADRLAFRVDYIEYGAFYPSTSTLDSWNAFYNFWTSAATQTYDWNMLLSQDLLKQSLETQIATSMGSSGDVDLDSISSSWIPMDEDGGFVYMDVEFTVHNVPICGPISIDAQIVMDLDMEGDTLVASGEIYPDLTMNWFCEFINFGFADIPKLIVIAVYPIPFTVANCTSWDDGRKFKCEYPIDLPVLGFSAGASPAIHLDSDEMRGEADGLVLGGSSDLWNPAYKNRLSITEFSLVFGMHGSCASGFGCDYHGKLSLDGSGRICRNGDEDDVQPGIQRGIWVRNDPLGVYGFHNAGSVIHLPGTADVGFDWVAANAQAFWAAPYPFQAHVRSTVGGKTFEIPEPENVSEQEIEDCDFDALAEQVDCWMYTNFKDRIFSYLWAVNPPWWDYIGGVFLGIQIYPGIEIENQASVLTVNIAPLLFENGQQVQGSFETCSGTLTDPNGFQTDLIFDAPAGVMESAAQSASEAPMEAQLRNLSVKGSYLVDITCNATIDGSNDYRSFRNITVFYVDPEAVPACDNDDCDGDGIPNEQEDGDADRDGWPDAFDTDFDNDGIDDADDNCPETWNENQADIDGDGIGDVCDCADPPVIDLSQVESHYGICNPHGARIELETPVIFDTCTPSDDLDIESYLISSNGVQMDIPLTGGEIDLPKGMNIILWVATDADGNQSEAEQLVDVVFEPSVDCCEDESDLYLGSSGFDFFYIDDGPACVASFGGGDVVYMTGLSNDYIWLGGGNDIVHARLGKSVIVAGSGHDIVHFACGGIAYGGQGWDYLECYGYGDAEVYGGTGRDIIKTGGGDDLVAPGGGRDQVSTGAGDDKVILYGLCEIEDGMVLDGGEGTDVLYLPEGVTESDLADMNVDVYGFEIFESVGIEKAGFATCN